MRTLTHILLVATAAISAPASAQNLITDGGFENAPPPSGGFLTYSAGTSFGGWTVAGGEVTTLHGNYAESGPLTFPAHGGSVSVDLTGPGFGSLNDEIFQNATTVAGQEYSLSFFLGNASSQNRFEYALPASLLLLVNGAEVGTFTNAAITEGTVNWAEQTFGFTAAGSQTRIAFRNATLGDSAVMLDDITLLALQAPGVPEPATWGMMIAGFGLVGGAMRSARRRENRRSMA